VSRSVPEDMVDVGLVTQAQFDSSASPEHDQ